MVTFPAEASLQLIESKAFATLPRTAEGPPVRRL